MQPLTLFAAHEGERFPHADFATCSSWSHGFTTLVWMSIHLLLTIGNGPVLQMWPHLCVATLKNRSSVTASEKLLKKMAHALGNTLKLWCESCDLIDLSFLCNYRIGLLLFDRNIVFLDQHSLLVVEHSMWVNPIVRGSVYSIWQCFVSVWAGLLLIFWQQKWVV